VPTSSNQQELGVFNSRPAVAADIERTTNNFQRPRPAPPLRVTQGVTQEPRTPSPIRSRVISNSDDQGNQQESDDFPLLKQFSREPTRRPQGRPFPDSDNIFLPAPTPPTQPQSPQSPRFPSRTKTTQGSPVRSNGQFSFGELPVRRRRGHKQGSQTR